MATGDGQLPTCMEGILLCCVLGVPGQDMEGSSNPAAGGTRVVDDEDALGEEERAASPASLRGCSWRMDS